MPITFRVRLARDATACAMLVAATACSDSPSAGSPSIAGIAHPRAALAEGAMVTGSATSTIRAYSTNGSLALTDANDGWLFSYPVVNGVAKRPLDPSPLYGNLDSAQVADTFPHYQPSGAQVVGTSWQSEMIIAQDLESTVTTAEGDVIRTTVSNQAPAGSQAVPCLEEGCPVAVIRQYRNGVIASEAVFTWAVAPDGSGYLLKRNKYTAYDDNGVVAVQMDVPVQQAQTSMGPLPRRDLHQRVLRAVVEPLQDLARAAAVALTPEELYAQASNCNGICTEAIRASREAGRAARDAARDRTPTKIKYAKEAAKYAIKVSIACSACMAVHGCGD